MFIDRTYKLKNPKKRYNTGNPEFILIYGRRRVGKTELIKNFGPYFLIASILKKI